MKGSLLSGAWCLVLPVRNEATCQRPYAREGKRIRGEKAVKQTPRCSYWVISNSLHDERRVPVFHAPAWSFMVGHERRVPGGGILSRYFTVGHERRVPEVCVFFNPDKDLHQPFSLLSFVLYLPAEGKTLSSAHGACDAQPLPSACPYSAAAKPRKSPVPPKLRRFNQLI